MGHAVGSLNIRRVNNYVPNMSYDANVESSNLNRFELGAPIALNATGLLSAQSIAVAGNAVAFAATYNFKTSMGRYGRNLTVVASGAATSAVRITGKDYLGQPMREDFTLNGTTPVLGKKAFKSVDKVDWDATAATTINVGWGNALGLPYAAIDMAKEIKNGIVAANAGTFVAADQTTVSATTGDTRGTLTPATVLPNGTNTFAVVCYPLQDNLHGVKHYFA